MTVRQITEITGKSEDTIIRSVRKLCPHIEIKHGIPLDLSEADAFKVLRSHESAFQLEVPQNAGEVPQNAGVKKLGLSGALVRSIESMYGKTEGGKRVDFLLGFPGVSGGTGSTSFLVPQPLSARDETALIIGLRVLNKQEREKKQGHLFPVRSES
jgi:hypothetical protein